VTRHLTPAIFLTLLACGGAAAPPPAAAAPAAAAPPPAAAAPPPSAAAAPAAALATPPLVEEAMGRVNGLLADPSDAAITAAFSPTFLAAVPPEKVKGLFTAMKAQLGACTERHAVDVKSDRSALVRLQCERGAVHATVVVNGAPPHLIDGLLLKPAP
jgi:hypothetical protein